MRIIFALLTCLLLTTSGFTQNAWFTGFTKDYSGVETWLQQEHRTRFQRMDDRSKIVVETSQATITYLFHQDRLYKIDMIKHFGNKRQGKAAFESCLKYFNAISAEQLDYAKAGPEQYCVSGKPGKVYALRLSEAEAEKQGFHLSLSTRDPRLAPPGEWESYDYQVVLDEDMVDYVLTGLEESFPKL